MNKTVGGLIAAALVGIAAFGIWKYALPGMNKGNDSVSRASVVAEFAQFTSLRNEAFKLEGANELDLASLPAMLPEGWVTRHDDVRLDETSGATIISQLRIENAENTALGITFGEISIWGGNLEVLNARMNGERLDETLTFATRIDAKDIELTGLETLMTGFIDSYTGAIEDVLPEDDELSAALEISIDDYSISMGRLIATDLKLLPWVLELKPPSERISEVSGKDEDKAGDPSATPSLEDEDWDELFNIFQYSAAYTRAFAAEKLAFYDTSYSFDMMQSGIHQKMIMTMPVLAYKGLRGGDLDLFIAHDMAFEMDMDIIEGGELDQEAIEVLNTFFDQPMTGKVDLYTIRNVRLDKVMNYLAIAQIPPRSETDLMSLGTFVMEGTDYQLGGESFYSIARLEIDGTGFYGFLPSDVSVNIDDLSYNIGGMMDMVGATQALDADMHVELEKYRKLLSDYGLDRPRFDFQGSWKADVTTGATDMAFVSGVEDFYHDDSALALTLPDAEQVLDLLYSEDINANAKDGMVRDLFESEVEFRGGHYSLKDEGGLDKIFAITVDVAKLSPDGQMAMFAFMEPDAVRDMATSMIGLGTIEAAKNFPPAQAYGDAFTAFIKEGGTFTVAIDPPEPLTQQMLADEPNDPQVMVDMLGLTVEHSTR